MPAVLSCRCVLVCRSRLSTTLQPLSRGVGHQARITRLRAGWRRHSSSTRQSVVPRTADASPGTACRGGAQQPLGENASPWVKVVGIGAGVAFLTLAVGVLSFPLVDALVLPWAFARALRLSALAEGPDVSRIKSGRSADSLLRDVEGRGLSAAVGCGHAMGDWGGVGDGGGDGVVDARTGRVVVLTGPAGCGKSTVLRKYVASKRPCVYICSRTMLDEATTLYEFLNQALEPLTLLSRPLIAYVKCANMMADMVVGNNEHAHNSLIFLYQFLGVLHLALRQLKRERDEAIRRAVARGEDVNAAEVADPRLRVPVLIWDDLEYLVRLAEHSEPHLHLLRSIAEVFLLVTHDERLCNVVFAGDSSLLEDAEVATPAAGGDGAPAGDSLGRLAPRAGLSLEHTRLCRVLPTMAGRARFYRVSGRIPTEQVHQAALEALKQWDGQQGEQAATAGNDDGVDGARGVRTQSTDTDSDSGSDSDTAAAARAQVSQQARSVITGGGGAAEVARHLVHCLLSSSRDARRSASVSQCLTRSQALADALSLDGAGRVRMALQADGASPWITRSVLARLVAAGDHVVAPQDFLRCPLTTPPTPPTPASTVRHHPAAGSVTREWGGSCQCGTCMDVGDAEQELARLEALGLVSRSAGINVRHIHAPTSATAAPGGADGDGATTASPSATTPGDPRAAVADSPMRLGYVLTPVAAAALAPCTPTPVQSASSGGAAAAPAARDAAAATASPTPDAAAAVGDARAAGARERRAAPPNTFTPLLDEPVTLSVEVVRPQWSDSTTAAGGTTATAPGRMSMVFGSCHVEAAHAAPSTTTGAGGMAVVKPVELHLARCSLDTFVEQVCAAVGVSQQQHGSSAAAARDAKERGLKLAVCYRRDAELDTGMARGARRAELVELCSDADLRHLPHNATLHIVKVPAGISDTASS